MDWTKLCTVFSYGSLSVYDFKKSKVCISLMQQPKFWFWSTPFSIFDSLFMFDQKKNILPGYFKKKKFIFCVNGTSLIPRTLFSSPHYYTPHIDKTIPNHPNMPHKICPSPNCMIFPLKNVSTLILKETIKAIANPIVVFSNGDPIYQPKFRFK